MQQVAEGVWRLSERPAPLINVYLVGDVLIDAGRKTDRRRIFKQLQEHEISLLALTHAHPDHQGTAKEICEARSVPLACHVDDVDAMEGRQPTSADVDLASRLIVRSHLPWWLYKRDPGSGDVRIVVELRRRSSWVDGYTVTASRVSV